MKTHDAGQTTAQRGASHVATGDLFGLSPLAAEMLDALKRLMAGFEQHPSGGFTTDDMKWLIGKVFVDHRDAIDELEAARLIRFTGFDDNCAESACSCYVPCPNIAGLTAASNNSKPQS